MPPLLPGQHLLQPGDNLQDAVNSLAAGHVLVLDDGTYTGTGTAFAGSNLVHINKDITIRALNPGRAILDGENARRLIGVQSGTVVLDGLHLTRGRTTTFTNGDDNINGWSTLINGVKHWLGEGGGLYVQAGDVTFSNGKITYSQSGNANWNNRFTNVMMTDDSDGGGVAILDGTLTITYSEISHNKVWANGGGIFVNGRNAVLDVKHSVISHNLQRGWEYGGGGAMGLLAGTATITNTTITDNDSWQRGGFIRVFENFYEDDPADIIPSVLNLVDTVIERNLAPGGGGIAQMGGVVNIDSCRVTDNVANDDLPSSVNGKKGGGYLGEQGRLNIRGNTTFSGNTAYDNVGINLHVVGAVVNVFFPLQPGHCKRIMPSVPCVPSMPSVPSELRTRQWVHFMMDDTANCAFNSRLCRAPQFGVSRVP